MFYYETNEQTWQKKRDKIQEILGNFHRHSLYYGKCTFQLNRLHSMYFNTFIAFEFLVLQRIEHILIDMIRE